MQFIRRHIVRCLVAGVAAILPIAGLILTVVYFEGLVAGSWLKQQGFYFFGLGLSILLVLTYFVGLIVSTVLGRWAWRWVDRLLDRLPVLGTLYQTLKQLIGYGEGPNALFRRAVFVSTGDGSVWELGLVTRESNPESDGRLTVFVPHAPSPTTGRLLLIGADRVRPAALTVSQTMQLLVSIGALSGATGSLLDSSEPAPSR